MASLLIHSEFVRRTTELEQTRRRRALLFALNRSASKNKDHHHNLRYYSLCYAAGGLSSSIRWVLAPLELIKMRMQTATTVSSDSGTMLGTARAVVRQDGVAGLFRGLAPTAVAYGFQTSTKYGLYEFFKDEYTHLAAASEQQQKYSPGLIYVAAAASAEFCADIIMCPFEMIKVHVQTADTKISTTAALRTMLAQSKSSNSSFPFGALVPLWARQIPGTVANFYVFEHTAAALYQQLAVRGGRPKHELTAAQQLGVSVAAGYVAGVCATVLSHPADMLVSCLPRYPGQSVWHVATRQIGLYNLCTRGLAPRILVTAKVICFQWLLYDTIKSCCFGLGTTGGGGGGGD